jgi:VanZ family protein
MSDPDITIRALALVSMLLYFTSGVRRFGISEHNARRLRTAAYALLFAAIAASILATLAL